MIGILYNGNPETTYVKGQRDVVVSKAAYLHTLVTLGAVTDSAYLSLLKNDQQAWKVVQPKYQVDVKNTIDNINGYNNRCWTEFNANLVENTTRILHENPNYDNKGLADRLYNLIHQMRPEFFAQAVVYNDLDGTDNHVHTCYGCQSMFHVNNKYTINLAYLFPGSPNADTVNSSFPRSTAERVQENDAKKLNFWITTRDCWTGTMVIRNN